MNQAFLIKVFLEGDGLDKIEYLRQELYNVIESGDQVAILAVSQELDVLIARYMLHQLNIKEKCVS